MRIAVTGSIATDHLMKFPGTFADSLVVDQLDKVALSFLVEDLEIRRGGVAANIAFGLGMLGQRPVLVGAVGEDFADYRSWLERHGVDCDSILVSDTRHTSRFICTTDQTMAQIASFYAGAMSQAREIEIAPIASRVGPLDLVVVSPNDPDAMLRHTSECQQRGIPFAADPSQQLAWADGDMVRRLVDGATYLFSNDYEAALISQKSGWSSSEVLSKVGTRVVTRGADGVSVQRAGEADIDIPAVAGVAAVDPTGVGDSFRAGFLAALSVGLDLRLAACVGCVVAASVVETTGTQEYTLAPDAFAARLGQTYGEDVSNAVMPRLDFVGASVR